MPKRVILLVTVALVLLATGPAWAHPKVDTVWLNNGDRITCEIKEMTNAKVSAGTDAAGTISIEWDDVVALYSRYYYRVETSHGERFYGALRLEKDSTELRVQSRTVLVPIPKDQVVEITPIETSFWSRFDGSLSFGYTFTKATEIMVLTFDWVNIYYTERNRFDTKFKSTITDESSPDITTQRVDASIAYNRLLKRTFTGNVSVGYQSNDELDLAGRFIGSLGLGWKAFRNNLHSLLISAGLAVNVEQATTSDTSTTSLEGTFSADYILFKYDSPKADITTGLDVFPSITEEGRYRAQYDIKLRYEVVSDLFVDLSFYVDYDNQPASGAAANMDYQIVTSVGWSY